jgi:hypothetical protein
MRRRLAVIAIVALIAANRIAAQGTVSDGIDAIVRGDYEEAVTVLKPLAESWTGASDPVAAFFMATLYENGLGVPADPVRACALYLRALGGPFASLVNELLPLVQTHLTPAQFNSCSSNANVGFDHQFQRASFELDQRRSITIDFSAERQNIVAIIRTPGNEREVEVPFGGSPGIRFLPVRHTELITRQPSTMTRQFIEFFAWIPTAPGQEPWLLQWSVFEVVENNLVDVGGASGVLSKTGVTSPGDLRIDVDDLAAVRVNADGDAEWAVLNGPNLSEIIEPPSERAEAIQVRRRREDADAKVDWSRVAQESRPPALNYSDGEGCADLFVYAWSPDRTEALTVRANKTNLQLSTTPKSFDLSISSPDLEIAAQVFERPRRSWPFCTDVFMNNDRWETWRAVGGFATIELSPQGIRRRQQNFYRATVRLTGAEFIGPSGVRIKQSHPITITVGVTGFSG